MTTLTDNKGRTYELKRPDGSPLQPGDIKAGQKVDFDYSTGRILPWSIGNRHHRRSTKKLVYKNRNV